MPATKTLAEMRTSTRELSDMEGSGFVEDAEVDRRLNEALRQLYDKLIKARGEHFYSTSASISTVVGQSLYTFASDFSNIDCYMLLRLLVSDGSQTVDVPSFEWSDLAALQSYGSSGGNSFHLWRYKLKPTGLELQPTPQAARTLTLHYIPAMTELANDSDTFDGVNGWERWACLTAAIDLLIKEESDPSGLMAQRAMIESDIINLASSRDQGRPESIQDTQRDHAWLYPLHRNDWNL